MQVSGYERNGHMEVGSLLLMLEVAYGVGAIRHDLVPGQHLQGVWRLADSWAPQALLNYELVSREVAYKAEI
jgi:hypothetical protein